LCFRSIFASAQIDHVKDCCKQCQREADFAFLSVRRGVGFALVVYGKDVCQEGMCLVREEACVASFLFRLRAAM
jgi:hypothetical protein